MAPMALALILGWCLAAASRAQQLPRPSLSLHPSQGVSMGDTVTLQCHLPRLAARVELYQGGRWRSVMDKKEDMAEFSLVSTEQEDAGTYRCKYRVLEPPWTSRLSEPVELVITGAEGTSYRNFVVAVVRGCAAALVFALGLYFILDARSLWIQRDVRSGDPQ
ncbi:platelet glycoprotein VI-like isoform X2 [Numida meleagris]|uniref:platelet glycoprotein VI-like isoform X2 n=1 Tax=Numida meleagris TaxID=8996 RepID=UPI000B3DC874|nr:platelet glycoprotein VI-like isoform X2 [Numida meleagris]